MVTEINKRVLVIIPCYNEAESVPVLYRSLREVKIKGCLVFPLFINDASTDETKNVLVKMGAPFLDNPVNLGIGGTVQLGFIYAWKNKFDFAVQMDGDGQHPVAELSKLIYPLVQNETDVIIGSRFMDHLGFRSTYLRRLGITFFYRLNKFLMNVSVKDPTSGYRAFNRKAIEHLVEYYPDEYPEPEVIIYLAHKKIRMEEVPVKMVERVSGRSSIRHFSTLYYMGKVTLNTIILHLKMKLNG